MANLAACHASAQHRSPKANPELSRLDHTPPSSTGQTNATQAICDLEKIDQPRTRTPGTTSVQPLAFIVKDDLVHFTLSQLKLARIDHCLGQTR